MDKLTTKLKNVVDWIKKRQASMYEYDYPVEFIDHKEYNLINFSGSFGFWVFAVCALLVPSLFSNWDKIIQLVNLLK